MVGFGSMVQSTDLGLDIALGATIGLWGLPGQVAMVELFAIGAPVLAIVTASSLANLRFMPMSVVMMPLFQGDKRASRLRFFLVQLLSVNIWSIIMKHAPEMPVEERLPFYCGASLTCLIGGVLGTVIGFKLASALPIYVTLSLVFLNPAYFVFVFSSVRQRNCIIAVIAASIMGPLIHQISPDWSAPITGVLVGTIAFYFDRWFLSHKSFKND